MSLSRATLGVFTGLALALGVVFAHPATTAPAGPATHPATRPDTRPATRPAPGLVTLAGNADKVVIPLLRADDMLLVHASINGEKPGLFVVDTGSTTLALDRKWTDEHALPSIAEFKIAAPGGILKTNMHEIGRVEIGDKREAVITDTLAVSVDLSLASITLGVKLLGIIGADLFQAQPFTIDYPASTLTLHNPAAFHAPDGEKSELEISRRLMPAVRMRIEDRIDSWFLVDTGKGGALELYEPFVQLHRGIGTGDHLYRSYSTTLNGVGSQIGWHGGSVKGLGRTWKQVDMTRREGGSASAENGYAGMIGAGLLEGGRFTFDYTGKHVWAEWPPSAKADTADELRRKLAGRSAIDVTGVTPLMLAARVGRMDVARMLLDDRADVSIATKTGYTALMEAAGSGNSDLVRLLLKAGANSNVRSGMGGYNAAQIAVSDGNAGIVSVLLAAGADVNLANANEDTPLHCAAMGDYADVAKVLIEGGAKLDGMNKDGGTALVIAAERGSIAIVRLILDRGVPVSQPARGGVTALMIAARKEQLKVVEFLLERGADINSSSIGGMTPLMYAAMEDRPEMIRFLLDHSADPLKRSSEAKTALDYAADSSASPGTVRQLAFGMRKK